MRIHFEPFQLDVGARELWKESAPVHLTRKAFDLLLLLIDHRPNVVTKDQIYQRLWPDTFVSDASLQALVSEVRDALDVDGSRDGLLRTVYGVGYAFRGIVREAGATPVIEHATVRGWLVGANGRIPLHTGENIMRRGDNANLDATTISRRHARILIDGEDVTLEDLDSKNGTWINDRPVTTAQRLSEGDRVRLGSLDFTFRAARRASSTQPISSSAQVGRKQGL
jgi:DNA-binding winged helix-turn-helix (wHTH) protein